MRRTALLTLLPLIWLAACQSTESQQRAPQRPCTDRQESAGTCSSISSFPELVNVN